MKSKILVIGALLTTFCVSFVATVSADTPVNIKQKLPSPGARPGQWVSDKSVRDEANILDENRITAMSIGGTFIGVDGHNPNIALKDKWIIHMFVDALRNAEWWSGNPEMAGNLNAYIAFGYRNLKEEEVNPEFPLNFGGFNQHFGPPFERAPQTR
ncbi:MAG: hypothetical protein H7308_02440 [Chthonomonadaceae bacterium]|nr:hypothetical protein [Chthonomonadaceae bacterium]